MMTSVVRNIQSYVKSQCVKNLMPMTTTLIMRRKAIQMQKLLVKALVENSLNLKCEKVYNEVSALAKTKGISNFWLGIHDISNEGKFIYDSDGKDLVWTNWNTGEPNDWRNGEDCVRSDDRSAGKYKWN